MSSTIGKLGKLARVLMKNPGEFRDRMLTFMEFQADRARKRPDLKTLDSELLLQRLNEAAGWDLGRFLAEAALKEIEAKVVERQKEFLHAGEEDLFHNASLGLARCCYAVCRALQPEAVIETGVGYGVTSAFFLQALAVNAKGSLWSIDLPPLSADSERQSGILVPTELRSRWNICRGRARDVLPRVFGELKEVDVFLHDSLHTYRNMTFEFQTAWPSLRAGGVLLSDDVGMNGAFENFCSISAPAFSATDGSSYFGVAVKGKSA
jgi:predicted O-methyltransferase YrrM